MKLAEREMTEAQGVALNRIERRSRSKYLPEAKIFGWGRTERGRGGEGPIVMYGDWEYFELIHPNGSSERFGQRRVDEIIENRPSEAAWEALRRFSADLNARSRVVA